MYHVYTYSTLWNVPYIHADIVQSVPVLYHFQYSTVRTLEFFLTVPDFYWTVYVSFVNQQNSCWYSTVLYSTVRTLEYFFNSTRLYWTVYVSFVNQQNSCWYITVLYVL
jgi:hypothetical protein